MFQFRNLHAEWKNVSPEQLLYRQTIAIWDAWLSLASTWSSIFIIRWISSNRYTSVFGTCWPLNCTTIAFDDTLTTSSLCSPLLCSAPRVLTSWLQRWSKFTPRLMNRPYRGMGFLALGKSVVSQWNWNYFLPFGGLIDGHWEI